MSISVLPEAAVTTYRYLRGGLVVAVAALAAGVLTDRAGGNCFEASISAYYFTSAHSVFVAVLCAAGVLMIVYTGASHTEDVLLSLAGVLAIVVAMVPTARPVIICGGGELPPGYEISKSVSTNIWAVTIALVLSCLALWCRPSRNDTARRHKNSVLGTFATLLAWVLIIGGFIVFVVDQPRFDKYAHGVSAVVMFAAICVTVGLTARITSEQNESECPNKRRYFACYATLSALMVVTIAGVVVVHSTLDGWNHLVIVAETILLVQFTVYWIVQTVELWRVQSRVELLTGQAREALATERAASGLKGLLDDTKQVLAAPWPERLLRAM
ncbi:MULTISPECIES: hypothetical protein [Mycobacteriaceae]|uniref:Uncharacterized protein n=1 Tax=Mycolicibacterium neoaurum VKM Ac-1815D TaxID=700508 RepID=V5XH61_MYCNE|nr:MULTISPECIES: hypothetical protein [Mycobacteriaceae]AHC27775.1 hypothetical protein D174_00270 [Mycolicibacterium neoaurum VKM Ac-1815D]AMO03883.1 hypothetical protein MyAD_00255 [Mycolicibacterium neoaurum]AXK77859.1 hypothetical protein DXK33_24915 [Mycolicibacterium neoaurum]KJQ48280.1 hypothetical protein TS71_22385 [Mycolicibacterium neoaurum]KUM06465.1 hypothetical protein AVZ31_21505 [Mycolicibacterium neoaurum]